ncbi:MAG: glycosyltransferase, partial [Oscillospiraceae bacterium]|nr:glycosyltransferase [Oscillospiraceae bacterium]
TYKNFELLIIDDCSKDSTLSIAEKFRKSDVRIRIIRNKQNSGVSYTRKMGLENAKGEWIAVLDSDDAWTPDKLEKQIRLQKETDGDLLYTGSAFMDQDGNLLKWYMHVPHEIRYKQLLKQNLISNSSSLVRKELYEEYYVSDDRMHEDFAVWLGILKNRKCAYGVDEPLLIYRLSKTSKSGNKIAAAKMNWNTYRYMGLNVFAAFYYECWYIVKGLLKYRNLKYFFLQKI